MQCTGYEMARYKGTQASHLYDKSMRTLCTISEQTLLAEDAVRPQTHNFELFHFIVSDPYMYINKV